MKLSFIVTSCFLLSMMSCGLQNKYQEYETTVTVVDMNGIPLNGREIKVFVRTEPFRGFIMNDEQIQAFAITDVNGRAVLRYSLNLSEEIQQFPRIAALDDDVLNSVNIVTHTVSSSPQPNVVKTNGTIQMDSLVPLSIRLKTNRRDVQALSLFISTIPTTFNPFTTTDIVRNFEQLHLQTTTPNLDTIIKTKVYSKSFFMVRSAMFFYNNPFSVNYNVNFDKMKDRNTVLVQTF